MTKHARSQLYKAAVHLNLVSKLQDAAVELWKDEQDNPTGPNGKPLGLRAICSIISDEYYAEKGQLISLSHVTLHRIIHGGQKKADCNAEKGWLTDVGSGFRSTLREERLISALKESEGRVAAWKQRVQDLQAHTVLQDLYVSGVRSELQASEQRKHKKKSRKLIRMAYQNF
ncbi:hypothetical protein H0H87_010505 [Tephrocybe sp. NHM501043]|nr:hypothetical protein H0H87_010505 [Tephrocybe sp. NHM501043]